MIRKASHCAQCLTFLFDGLPSNLVVPQWRKATTTIGSIFLKHHRVRTSDYVTSASARHQTIFDCDSFEKRIICAQKEKARALLDERKYPLGSFTEANYSQVKHILEGTTRQRRRDADSVCLSLDLLERIVRELKVRFCAKQSAWVCHPPFFNAILHNYQVAAKRGDGPVLPPEKVWKRFLNMTQRLPKFQPDNVTVAILFDVMLHLQSPSEKPQFAEKFLNDLWIRWRKTPIPILPRPDRNIYTLVLLAWANSNLPIARQKIENLITNMRTENIAFDEVTYNIYMKYHAERGEQNKVDSIMKEMQNDGVKPTRTTLSHVIYCHCYLGNAVQAEKVLHQLIQLKPKNQQEMNIVGECVQLILSVHRKKIKKCNDDMEKLTIIRSAERLFQYTETSATNFNEQERSSMMDLYAHNGSHDQLERMFHRMNQKTLVACNILIKSYGRQDMADKAMALLQKMLERTSTTYPDLVTFNSVLNAWADSSQANAVENAMEVLRLMDENPDQCLRPDVYSFSTMLKCLAKNPCENTTRRVQDLLDDMDKRYHGGQENVKPNFVCYTLAVKACVSAGDLDDALMILDEMEKSGLQPNAHAYNEILRYWSSRNNAMAAERAEQFLHRMRQQQYQAACRSSSAGDQAFQTLNSYSYTHVMTAWLNSGSMDSSERAWRIYELMKSDNISPNIVTLSTLISFLACSYRPDLLCKADVVLGDLEVRSDSDEIRLDNRFYSLVLKGWIAVGDSKRALSIANRLIDTFILGGQQGLEPDPANFDLVVNALLDSKDISLATVFVDTVEECRKKGVLPIGISSRSLTQLLDAWRLSSHTEKDVPIARLESYLGVESLSNDA